MASTSRSTRRRNIRPAIPTCCSAPSRPMRRAGSSCTRPSSRSAAAPGPTTSTRCCAACAPWACGWSATSRARSTSRAGWKASRAWRGAASRPGQPSRTTSSGSATFAARAASSPIVLAGGGQKQAHAFLDALRDLRARLFLGRLSRASPCRSSSATAPSPKAPYEGPLIRLQIGLEDVEDLKADIARGLAAAAAA